MKYPVVIVTKKTEETTNSGMVIFEVESEVDARKLENELLKLMLKYKVSNFESSAS